MFCFIIVQLFKVISRGKNFVLEIFKMLSDNLKRVKPLLKEFNL